MTLTHEEKLELLYDSAEELHACWASQPYEFGEYLQGFFDAITRELSILTGD